MLWVDSRPNHKNRPENLKMVRRLGSGNIGNHDLSKPPNNPTTDLAKPHRSFSFWDFPALLQLHVGTRGMGPEFFLRGPFKQPNLKPQTLEILGFEKGPKCHGSCISLLLLHLEQSQAQHGVVFASGFWIPWMSSAAMRQWLARSQRHQVSPWVNGLLNFWVSACSTCFGF